MLNYLDLLRDVLENGIERPDRTGVGTLSVFGRQLRCNLATGFPLLTTKKVFFQAIVHELLWFIRGSSNNFELQDVGVHIWDQWAREDGSLGPLYGAQWRSWGKSSQKEGIDQLSNVLFTLRMDPYSRRHIVSAWNVDQLEEMALYPCHILMQFYVVKQKLSCQMYQRSADAFLGVPFNIASYALLTEMMAQVLGYQAGEMIYVFGDFHLYVNHIAQAERQLAREPYALPTLQLNPDIKELFAFQLEDIQVDSYRSHPRISADIAV